MTPRNPHFIDFPPTYLFSKIRKKKEELLQKNPSAKIISLGIGDTTEPLTPTITSELARISASLGTREGYMGYGPEQGIKPLREKIATVCYNNLIEPDEVFVSDGAKCDIARLQLLFGSNPTVAIQDPAYPVYVDTSVIIGKKHLVDMPCTAVNNFFPKLTTRTDLIYFCSPNNPTGATATFEQLESLVSFAKKNRSIIIFDAAYSRFIQDPSLPKSIFEIPGACEVALEVNSLSKPVGFTGVRLSWTIVPKKLKFDDGSSVHADWLRLMTTCFNGASILSQMAALVALNPPGLLETQKTISFYMENAKLLRSALSSFEVYGGEHVPYLWVRTSHQKSWDAFDEFLTKYHIVTTPGSGFGPSGEGFLRFSAFSPRDSLLEACDLIQSSRD